MTPTTWHVYRDGWRWTVKARHLADALRRACMQTDSMSGRQYVDAGTRREQVEPGDEAPDGLPIALRGWGTAMDGVEAVHHRGGETTVHVVDVTDRARHDFACSVLERAKARMAAIRDVAELAMVREASGSPVAVRCFRSGPKGLSVRAALSVYQAGKLERDGSIVWHSTAHMRRLLDELERDGLIKWPRGTVAAERAHVLEGIVRNVELAEYIDAMQAMLVDATERVCERLVPPPKSLDAMTESELRERREQLAAELAALHAMATARHDVNARAADVDRRLDLIDTRRDHGFDVGALAWMLPSTWHDIQHVRRVKVLDVEVQRDVKYGGTLVPVEHRRLVQIIDASEREPHVPNGQQWTTVEMLRTENPA